MPSGKEPVSKKVKPRAGDEEEAPKPQPKPSRRHDEFVLAETRTAKPTDGAPMGEDTDPAEVVGMGKIGTLPKGDAFKEPKKEIPEVPEQPEVPEPIIEEAIQEGPTEEEEPDYKLPPPPIPDGAKEVRPPKDLFEEENAGKEQEVEVREVSIGADGRKIKVLSVKPQKLPPPPEEEDEEPAPKKGGVRDLSEERVEMPPPKGRVRRTPGLGVDVELDAETFRKLSAPVLPAEFSYPNRAVHSRFRRCILFFIFPVLFAVVILLIGALNIASMVALFLSFIVVLIYFLVYGVSAFYTAHTVTKRSVILKHGAYFEAVIPLRDIKTVKLYEDKAGDMGIRVDRDHRLFALTDKKEMVEIVLKGPTTVASHSNIQSVITNVEQPNTFIKTVKSATAALKEDTCREAPPEEEA